MTGSAGVSSAPVKIHDGTVEAIKWLALVLMTADHVNKYLFHEQFTVILSAGRLCVPLFGFVLAYNLARSGVLDGPAIKRTLSRLALYGAAATPFFIGLGFLMGGWYPLNVLFMLFCATLVIYCRHQGGLPWYLLAVTVFIVGGAFVEYWWFGIAFCYASWRWVRRRSLGWLLAMALSCASLYVVNQTFWAMVALPIIFAAPYVQVSTPRIRNLFYVYYPAHLAVLLVLQYYLGLA